jgi:hypothetical protein
VTAQEQDAVAARLLGTWKMVSWTRRLVATGEEADAFGPRPIGTITYSADGRVTALVVKAGRRASHGAVASDQEKIALFDSLLAYAGRYRVEADRIIHRIDASWNESWTGSEQTRFYKLDGNRLTLTGAPAKSPIDGQETVYTIVWEKF